MEPLIRKVEDGYRIPGMVDAHVHIESSHLTPAEFGRLLVANGTFAAVCDPHEIVNVAGETGFDFMLGDAERSPADLFFAVPSCVPASPYETPGAMVDADETARFLDKSPRIVSLGEMMNVPGTLARDEQVMSKIAAAIMRGKRVDGHFPGGRGEAVLRYAAAGIQNDHESTTAEEARDKVAAGMTVFIREGSSAKDLAAILPVVTDENWEHFCFCTDDCSAADIAAGHGILDCVRKAVRLGMSPERAVAIGSVNAVRHFGLEIDPEAYVVVKDLVDFEIVRVVPPRRLLSRDITSRKGLRNSVHLPDLKEFAFPKVPKTVKKLLAIGVVPGSLMTERVEIDAQKPFMRLAVIERHGRNGNIAYAPVTGVGHFKGALATTVVHDSHNLIVMGDNDADMRQAAEELRRLQGGAVVVSQGRILAEMSLPLGGLMSDCEAKVLSRIDHSLRETACRLGCTLAEPLTMLSFLALPVIPHLKLTDKGLFDVDTKEFVKVQQGLPVG